MDMEEEPSEPVTSADTRTAYGNSTGSGMARASACGVGGRGGSTVSHWPQTWGQGRVGLRHRTFSARAPCPVMRRLGPMRPVSLVE